MTKNEFYDTIDFGVKVSESFEDYITRVGGHIQEYKIRFGEPSDYLKAKIIEIFESTLNPMSTKYQQVYNLLRLNLKRKPRDEDFQELVEVLKKELNKSIQKELYGKQIQL